MKKLLTLLFVVCTSMTAWAQDVSVTGKVTQATDGSPLPGVSILVKGTTNGAISDGNGDYSVKCASNATLVVSMVGMATKEVAVNGASSLNISMEEQKKDLNQVMVTALGVKRNKEELGYAAQKVDGSLMTVTRSNNALSALSGKVSGVEVKTNNQMGGSTNIVVRGFKSLTGNNQALIVVDGVPVDNANNNSSDQTTGRSGYDYGNAAFDINPDDIQSINVLKGAAATALYGSRASNGVVLIETKKGKKGFGLTVNMGMSQGRINKNTFPQYQKEYGAGYGAFYDDTLGAYFYKYDLNGDGNDDLIVPVTEDASFGAKFDPTLNVYDWRSVDPASPNYLKATPWVAGANDPSYFLQNPSSYNNGFTFTTGNDRTQYKLGFNRTTESGILPNSNLFKNMLNFSVNQQVNDRLSTGATANVSYNGATGRYGTGYDAKNPMTNFRQWWQVNADMSDLKAAYEANKERNTTWNWGDFTDVSAGPIFWDNPYFVRYKSYESDSRTRMFGNMFANYQVNTWMSVMARVTMDAYSELQEERIGVGSIDVSEYNRTDRSYREFNYDLFASFNKQLTSDIKFNGMLGTNIRKQTINSIYSETNGGLNVPNLYSLSNSVNPLNAPSESSVARQVNGIFADAIFGYKNYLYLDLTARRDVSSTLAPKYNTYYYPSASLSYVFTNHMPDLFKAFQMSYGKARVNFAKVGSDAPYGRTRDYFVPTTPFAGNPIYSVSSIKNEANLKPEQTSSYEAGLELGFFKDRLTLDASYYNAITYNQIIPVEVSRATGFSSKYINAGKIKNYGFEVSLGARPLQTKDFAWDINLNWTRNRNMVMELPDIDNIQLATFQGGVSMNATVGEAYGTLKGKSFVYNEGRRMVDTTTGYYMVTETSDTTIGNINPRWMGGMRNTFRYKNVSLSFLIDAKMGGSVFSLDQFYGAQTGVYSALVSYNGMIKDQDKYNANLDKDALATTAGINENGVSVREDVLYGDPKGGIILDGVSYNAAGELVENTKRVTVDYYLGNSMPAAAYVYDASYIKLREVNLTYSVPTKYISKMKLVKGIDISLYGRNLAILFKNVPFADPEDGMSSGNIQGFQSGAYPTARIFGGNLRFNF